jgi:hypothetical protein
MESLRLDPRVKPEDDGTRGSLRARPGDQDDRGLGAVLVTSVVALNTRVLGSSSGLTRGSIRKGLPRNEPPFKLAKSHSQGDDFFNSPNVFNKTHPSSSPSFSHVPYSPRSAFGYTGCCEPGEAEPAPEGAAVAGQTLRAGCNGLPPVAGRWLVKTSDGLSQPRSQRPSGVPQGHTNKAPDLRETGLVTKTAGAQALMPRLPGRGSGRDVRTSAENLKPPGHPARTSR